MNTIKALVLATSLLTAGGAQAATIFAPTDSDVNFLLSSLSSGTLLAMFDDEDQTFSGSSLAIPVPEIISFSPSGGDYIASNEAVPTESLLLTNSAQFILAISTDGGTSWNGDESVTYLGANSYNVTFSDGSVLEVDAQVVPVPAAAWLFGSGLMGMIAVARRRK